MKPAPRVFIIEALLIGLAYGLGQIIRDCSLTCNVGYKFIPLAFLGLAIFSFPIVMMQTQIVTRRGWLSWRKTSLIVGAGGMILFRAAMALALAYGSHFAIQATYGFFFVAFEVLFLVLFSNIFSSLSVLGEELSKKTLSITAMIVIVGGAGGALIAQFAGPALHEFIGERFETTRDHFLIPIALLLGFAMILVKRAAIEMDVPRTATGALKILFATREMRRMTAFFFLTGFAIVVLDYLFYWLVSTDASGSVGLLDFFAGFYLWLSGLSLLLILAAGRIMRRAGLVMTLIALPAVMVFGGVFLLLKGSLVVVCVIRALAAGVADSFFEPATERILADIGQKRSPALRPLLENLTTNMGQGAAAIAVLILTFVFDVSRPVYTGIFLVVVVGWLATTIALRQNLRDVGAK